MNVNKWIWGAVTGVCSFAVVQPGALLAAESSATNEPAPVRLFNGRDLAGWDTWLGPRRPGEPPLGKNHDPHRVFTVVREDAAPAIRISGEVWGALATTQEFDNYRLHVQFKWGQHRWPPRDHSVRDSGILYHGVGDPDPHTGWMRSFECQIEEMDCGDFWSVRGAVAFVPTRRLDTTDDLRQLFSVWCQRNEGTYAPYGYWPGGALRKIDRDGLMKSLDAENPTGMWNDVDIYCNGSNSVHVINGQTNMVLLNLSQPGPGGSLAPLTRGKIELQSEGAEIFFRDLVIYPAMRRE